MEILDVFRVQEAPPTVYYIRDFIDQQQHEHLWGKIYTAPIPKWRTVDRRRVQNWGGSPHPKGMFPETLPDWLQAYSDKIGKLKLFQNAKFQKPNHVLINEYPPETGIMMAPCISQQLSPYH